MSSRSAIPREPARTQREPPRMSRAVPRDFTRPRPSETQSYIRLTDDLDLNIVLK